MLYPIMGQDYLARSKTLVNAALVGTSGSGAPETPGHGVGKEEALERDQGFLT